MAYPMNVTHTTITYPTSCNTFVEGDTGPLGGDVSGILAEDWAGGVLDGLLLVYLGLPQKKTRNIFLTLLGCVEKDGR